MQLKKSLLDTILKNENKFRLSLCRYFENDFELNQDLKDILKGKDI